jgi:hypothetical protein
MRSPISWIDGLAVDDLAAVDVHVLFLPLPQRRVGGDLQRGEGAQP